MSATERAADNLREEVLNISTRPTAGISEYPTSSFPPNSVAYIIIIACVLGVVWGAAFVEYLLVVSLWGPMKDTPYNSEA